MRGEPETGKLVAVQQAWTQVSHLLTSASDMVHAKRLLLEYRND